MEIHLKKFRNSHTVQDCNIRCNPKTNEWKTTLDRLKSTIRKAQENANSHHTMEHLHNTGFN